MIRLTIVSGPDAGRMFELKPQGQISIGRGAETTTQLTDPSISRTHCFVENLDGQLRLFDGGSSSGTLVNSVPVSDQIIYPGDLIQVGDTEIRVESIAASVTSATPIAASIPGTRDLNHLIGETVGAYVLESNLATGERGQVFKARSLKNGKTAVVKVLWPDLCANIDERRRFERAMKTMHKVRHPNIVRLYQAASSKKGGMHFCWFASEFVDGPSLRGFTSQVGTVGMMDWQIAWHVTLHIARALEFAHENGFVHRNISPDNILMSASENTSKLGDLMLARATDHLTGSMITRPGQIIGDVSFMAPERTMGEIHSDIRADIYSLGATIYSVLAGQPPFHDLSVSNLIARIQSEDALPIRTYHLGVEPMFESIIMKMMARHPDQRYQAPAELCNELERVAHYAGIA